MNRQRRMRHKLCFFLGLGFIFFSLISILPSWGQGLVSNVEGKIHVVILHYGDGSWGTFWHDMTVYFRDLMDKMSEDVAFVVVLGKDTRANKAREILQPYAVKKLPDGTPRVKFLTVDVETNEFYPWSRDAYLILADGEHNLTFLDVGFGEKPFPIVNFDDIFANAKSLAGVIHRGGGNIRTTSEEMIIGMDTMLGISLPSRGSFLSEPEENLYMEAKELKPEDVPLFKARFEAYCRFIHKVLAPDRNLVIPGMEDFFARLEKGEFPFERKNVWHTGAQAAYHTDVYLGLGYKDEEGKRVIFIADSKLGAQVVEGMTPEERRQVERALPGVLTKEGFTACGIPVTAEQIAQRFQWEKNRLLDKCLEAAGKASDALDKAAQRMENLGYRVVRIPYLPNGLVSKGFFGDVLGMSFNYSNILTEVYENVKKVYIPEFGFPQLDEAAVKAYRSAGFQVVVIDGFVTHGVTTIQDGAGLDCLTSEIRFPVRWAENPPN
ncbi:MAG: hypothetical protein JXB23_17530 [Candidatus Aminicenantes bacterium]|nr:hypothetical protein [Candidatus Aminicenantes bacterium]